MRTFFFLAFLATLPLSAGTIVTGGQLLNQTDANQLATWFGQGDLTLTNVFSSAPGVNASTQFHTAVDGKGPTFVLIQTSLGLVGGYDPLSWSSSPSQYNTTLTDAGRTAFIFNLTTLTEFAQRLMSQSAGGGDTGIYQTFNTSGYGPAFGGGHDLVVNVSDLSIGYAYSYSYGNGLGGANLFGITSTSFETMFTVTRVEAFTVSNTPANTPEPMTLVLCGTGLFGLLAVRTKLSSAQCASAS